MAPPNDGPGSIYSRNRDDCIEAASQLFRLLCDSEQRRKKMTDKLLTEDCILAGLEHDGSLYARKTSPNARKFVKEEFEPWTAYRIHDDCEFVEVDMMSSALTYKVTIWVRDEETGAMDETETMCTSVFKQNAGSEWQVCLLHMSRVQDEDDDEEDEEDEDEEAEEEVE